MQIRSPAINQTLDQDTRPRSTLYLGPTRETFLSKAFRVSWMDVPLAAWRFNSFRPRFRNRRRVNCCFPGGIANSCSLNVERKKWRKVDCNLLGVLDAFLDSATYCTCFYMNKGDNRDENWRIQFLCN